MYMDLGELTLARFIDIFLGDVDKVVKDGTSEHTESDRMAAAEKLCNDYMVIVGGKSVLSVIARRGELLKLQMRETCLNAARRLAVMGEWDGAMEIMGNLGYRVKPEQLMGKIKSVQASGRYRMAKLQDGMKEKEGVRMDREYFTRERVSVMSHTKMYIDEHTFTAKEYAYMVKMMCDEIDNMMRSMGKKK